MKQFLQRYVLLVLAMLTGIISSDAETFIKNGIVYKTLQNRNAQVLSGYDYGITYMGDLEIPPKIIYEGITYSVVSIGGSAFANCSDLKSISLPESIDNIQSYAFLNCSGMLSLTMPNAVTKIRDYAFKGCSRLSSIVMGNSISAIGDGAFNDCSELTTIKIPRSVISLGEKIFVGCRNLETINVDYENTNYASYDGCLFNKDKTILLACPPKKEKCSIPDFVNTIGKWAFYDCNALNTVSIPNTVTTIEDEAFHNCRALIAINIPNSVTYIGKRAFACCSSLPSITIPNSVKEIEMYAFYDCDELTHVTVPNSIQTLKWGTFSECGGLTTVSIPDCVTTIENNVFFNCYNLTSIKIPISVTTIGASVFYGCKNLSSINIPNALTSIGVMNFDYCEALRCIYNQMGTPLECNLKFSDNQLMNTTLYVPTGTKKAYEKVDPWRNFWNIQEYDYSVISDIESDNNDIQVLVDGGHINILGIKNEMINIYDIQGHIVYSGYDTSIDKKNFSLGLYIIKIGNKTSKIAL